MKRLNQLETDPRTVNETIRKIQEVVDTTADGETTISLPSYMIAFTLSEAGGGTYSFDYTNDSSSTVLRKSGFSHYNYYADNSFVSELELITDYDTAVSANDVIAKLTMSGFNTDYDPITYGTIRTEVASSTPASEGGRMEFDVIAAGSALTALTLGGTSGRWNVTTSGHLVPGTDIAYDIGTSSVGVRNIYVGTSGDAFDDYDEGTWTPGLSFGGGTTGITYSVQVGNYTKIGNVVAFNGYVVITNNGSSTGVFAVTGLPFTSESTSNNETAISLHMDNATGVSGGIFGILRSNATTIDVRQGVTGNSAQITDTEVLDSATLWVGGTYRTA